MENLHDYRYKKAKEKFEKIKSFYFNLLIYCVVISFLAYLNYQSTSFPWVLFPAFAWGAGLVAQWMDAFEHNPIFGRDWEERKIQELMDDDEF